MADFTDDHKKERNAFFATGVHKVHMMGFQLGETDDKKEFLDITVVDPENDERSDTARLWFNTDKAIGYSFSILRAIFVHNAPAAKKDATRTKFDSLKNTTELEKACLQAMVGKEAFFTVYESDTRTYTATDGTTKKSFDKNIYGYAPEPKKAPVSEPQTVTTGGDEQSADAAPADEQQPFPDFN